MVPRRRRSASAAAAISIRVWPITPGVYDDFYQYHYEHGRYLYSDRLIYTKGVTVFKNEDLSLKERNQWFRVDVITCAAPILFMLPHTNSAVLGDLFRSRIRNIFNAAIDNDIRVLILGAFGCGAFKNPPEIVAQAFRGCSAGGALRYLLHRYRLCHQKQQRQRSL